MLPLDLHVSVVGICARNCARPWWG